MTERFALTDKVAIVTGGSRGIGRAIAIGMAEEGAHVVVAARKMSDLEEVAAEIRERGRRALPVAANLTRKEDIDSVVDAAVKEFGRIDILVNNAATNIALAPLVNVDPAVWDKTMDLNLKGPFLMCQAVGKVMMKNNYGRIVNISSRGGVKAFPDMGIYSISKAGVIMLTRVLAHELAPYGIRVNCIAPGLVQTRFSEALWNDPERSARSTAASALKRFAQPEELVGAAVFLASEASSFITGETILVDGGSMA